MQHSLDAMRRGFSFDQAHRGPVMMPSNQLKVIVYNTVVVMTTVQERHTEWHEIIVKVLKEEQQRGTDCHNDIEFLTAILTILDGNPAVLANDHPYAPAIAQIQEGIAAGGPEDNERTQIDALPFDAELIPRRIVALLGGPQEKMAHGQYLTAMSTQTTDEALKALFHVIQLGLFGSDPSQLGQNLTSVYREAWEAIVVGVESGGVDPRLFEMIVQNTLAVLGPAADKKNDWRERLKQIRSQGMERGV